MRIQHFYDSMTATISYVVWDESTKKCAVIDSVLDYNPESGKTSTRSSDQIIDYIEQQSLKVEWILDTHIHADHLTGSQYIKHKLGGKIAIGEKISEVLDHWVPLYNTQNDTPFDGSQFDHLFKDEEQFNIGKLQAKVIHTPGHTPACVSFIIEDAVFVGDTLFKPQSGTARADFPGGSAQTLYQSIQKIFSLGDHTRIYLCHDYPEAGQEPTWMTTVAEERKNNTMINDGISKEQYIKLRSERDKNLAVPRLLLPSIQVNLRAGDLGEPEQNGIQYIKIPLNQL